MFDISGANEEENGQLFQTLAPLNPPIMSSLSYTGSLYCSLSSSVHHEKMAWYGKVYNELMLKKKRITEKSIFMKSTDW